jgi:hypothetical protein
MATVQIGPPKPNRPNKLETDVSLKHSSDQGLSRALGLG